MRPFTDHPQAQGFTYAAHFLFAAGIVLRLLQSAFAFAIHAVFPFVSIERRLDLEATSAYLLERNEYVERSALLQTDRFPSSLVTELSR